MLTHFLLIPSSFDVPFPFSVSYTENRLLPDLPHPATLHFQVFLNLLVVSCSLVRNGLISCHIRLWGFPLQSFSLPKIRLPFQVLGYRLNLCLNEPLSRISPKSLMRRWISRFYTLWKSVCFMRRLNNIKHRYSLEVCSL
jgi:hypothetical protein